MLDALQYLHLMLWLRGIVAVVVALGRAKQWYRWEIGNGWVVAAP